MPTFGNFLHTQLVLKIPKPTTSFASKTVIITGASSGIGKEAARHIVRLGASKVILGCRNITKGDRAKREIESSLGCSQKIIEVWEVDIESPESIKKFVDRVNYLSRLDVVINNAGLALLHNKYQVPYGTERNVAVNVIGTFLLALQLIPKLKQTATLHGVTPHMTFTSSALYDVAKYPEHQGENIFTWMSDKSHVDMMNQYNLSKLLLLHAIIKLSSIVDPVTSDKSRESSSIVINSLDPCFCKTQLGRDISGMLKVATAVFAFLFARTAEEGSRLVVKTASAGRETHGGYMRGGALKEYAPFVTNEDGVKKTNRVWEDLCTKLEQLQPGILENLNAV
ncbi:hypothetical protein THITE_2116303 [Paecilomyces variotii No. 5]|uniref:Short-chain dehydrogenase/reductase family protein n=1 Tax=Byssochlamys spectabilis (strain No. 5 / NBRC 109023) TaxID=1356009 RepID=V5G7I1_BYSSN|nr:hypothetical protein THITE_2116303 [Paecilomyces variotii No. 5]